MKFYRLRYVSQINQNTYFLSKRFYHSKNGTYGYNPAATPTYDNFKVDDDTSNSRAKLCHIFQYVDAYRKFGHLKANINPLAVNERNVVELHSESNFLEMEESISTKGLISIPENKIFLNNLEKRLNEIYCGEIGAEFMYLPTLKEREWFANAMEESFDQCLNNDEKKQIAADLIQSQVWDNFLAVKFQSVKRYGAEGAESFISFFRELLEQLCKDGVEEVIVGNAHRGRLNLLTGLLQVPPEVLFHKLKGNLEYPDDSMGTGDAVSHFISSVDLDFNQPKKLHVTMLYNPSHLEAVDPVACGKARGRQRRLKDGHYCPENPRFNEDFANNSSSNSSSFCSSSDSEEFFGHKMGDKVVCVQAHGDAALSGQGIVQETLAMADVPHFTVGGSIHLCINNQLGFTTPGERGRSSLYTTDVAKLCSFPVLHVNGDHPEAVVKAARLAVAYNRTFRRDIFVDLICWRKWGHNELDNPRITNPSMYSVIDNRQSVPDTYTSYLVENGIWSENDVKDTAQRYYSFLNDKLKATDNFRPAQEHLLKHWSGMVVPPNEVQTWDTGVDVNLLKYLGAKSVQIPPYFTVNSSLKKSLIDARLENLSIGKNIDWATGESLAIASLLYEGYDVRLSGQDVGRGTFSQRHCMLVDQKTDELYIPLNHMSETNLDNTNPSLQGQCDNKTENQDNTPENLEESARNLESLDVHQGYLEVANSILSEEAVLGFEYGVSIDSPNILCIWEAQFGDFFNGAQTILDTFVSSGEDKWLLQSGLTLLLPHGYDGFGPEHSSCRYERFLQMSNSSETIPDSERVNWNVIFPTTSSQIFHALRKQMIRNFRKPLVIVGPKFILRLPAAFSDLSEMGPGTYYKNVIGDDSVDAAKVQKVVFVSGKHFYFLKSERDRLNINDTALIRVETLCPFPTKDINEQLSMYKNAKKFVWAQEEHRNMGAWTFVCPRFRSLCGTNLMYAGRKESGAAAVGVAALHKKEVEQLTKDTFEI